MTKENYAKHAETWGLFSGDRTDEENCWANLSKRYGKTILVPMSATGEMAVALAKHGFQVTAVDIEEEMIREGQSRYSDIDGLNMIQGDLCSLDLNEKNYDFAFIGTSSFHHFLSESSRQTVLANIASHLRPGGGLAMELWYPPTESWSSPWREFDSLKKLPDPNTRVWKKGRSEYDAEHRLVTITQEIFVQKNDTLDQFSHAFQMQLFDREALKEMLEDAGYDLVNEYGSYNLEPWTPESSAWIIEVVKK